MPTLFLQFAREDNPVNPFDALKLAIEHSKAGTASQLASRPLSARSLRRSIVEPSASPLFQTRAEIEIPVLNPLCSVTQRRDAEAVSAPSVPVHDDTLSKPAPGAQPADAHIAQLHQYGRATAFAKGKASKGKRPPKTVVVASALHSVNDEESGMFTADAEARGSRAASRSEFTPSKVHSRNTVL